jgi:hypothetical protein
MPNGKALVRVGHLTTIAPIRAASADQVGARIPALTLHLQGNWLKNGALPVKPKEMPDAVDYYESWDGNDAATGVIESDPFATPMGSCVVLSGANGPSSADLSEILLDADTHQTIAAVPLEGFDTSWHFWQVKIPAGIRHLQIRAEDGGQGWGEWLAIAEPRTCK